MKAAESPGAVAAHGASETDELRRRVVSETNLHQNCAQGPIRASLIGSDRCEAEGYTVHDAAPVLKTCRKLIAAGFDPDRSLHAYRGEMLCIVVKSVGMAATLMVDEHNGTRFAKWKPFSRSAVSARIASFETPATTLHGDLP